MKVKAKPAKKPAAKKPAAKKPAAKAQEGAGARANWERDAPPRRFVSGAREEGTRQTAQGRPEADTRAQGGPGEEGRGRPRKDAPATEKTAPEKKPAKPIAAVKRRAPPAVKEVGQHSDDESLDELIAAEKAKERAPPPPRSPRWRTGQSPWRPQWAPCRSR